MEAGICHFVSSVHKGCAHQTQRTSDKLKFLVNKYILNTLGALVLSPLLTEWPHHFPRT